MEIGATSSTYLPPQLIEPRVARSPAREATSTQESSTALTKERKDNLVQRSEYANSGETLNPHQTLSAKETQAAENVRGEREKQPAGKLEESKSAQQVAIASGGSIKMDVEDGDRVLRVFDSKDVLIYQLPPKGALMLIKAQENAQQSQVQTSA